MHPSSLVAGAVLTGLIFSSDLSFGSQSPLGTAPVRRIEVRVYLRTPLERPIVGGMLREAARVWRPYGVELEGYVAAEVGKQPGPPAELVRVVIEGDQPRRGTERPSSEALGWVEFLEPGLPRDVVHVSAGRAARMMAGASWAGAPLANRTVEVRRWALSRALGRALAHELGHYLLRSTSHSVRGLMRGDFRRDDLVDERLDLFRLLPEQHARLAEVGEAVLMARQAATVERMAADRSRRMARPVSPLEPTSSTLARRGAP